MNRFDITCAQVGNKCGLTSALIGQKSEPEPSSNLCGDVSIFIPNWGTILPGLSRAVPEKITPASSRQPVT